MALAFDGKVLIATLVMPTFFLMPSCKFNTDGRTSSTEGSLDAAAVLSAGGFLKSSDFDVPKERIFSFSKDIFQAELDSRSNFYANSPKSASLMEDACTTSELKKMKFRATGSSIVLDGRPNLKKCAENLGAADSANDSVPKYTFSTYDVHILVALECEGVDLSKYDGQSYLDVAAVSSSGSLCDGATKARLVTNRSIVATGEAERDGQKSIIDSKSLNALMTADGKPCVKERSSSGSSKLVGECLQIEANIEKDDANSIRFMARESGLSAKGKNDLYYGEGTVKFELNDWTGEMTYTGANNAPTWKAKGGSSNEEAAGTFGDSFKPSKSDSGQDDPSEKEPTPVPEATATPTPGGAGLRLAPAPRKFAVPSLPIQVFH